MAIKTPLVRAARRMERYYEQIRQWPTHAWEVDQPMSYEEASVKGKNVYILGESHGSREPFDHFRQNLEQAVISYPREWLFFLEEGQNGSGQIYGVHWYLKQVAGIFRIPVLDAIKPSIYSPEARVYVLSKTGMSEEDFYAVFLHNLYQVRENHDMSRPDLSRIARDLQVDLEKAKKIVKRGPLPLDFGSAIGRFWNELIHERFLQALDAHPEKSKVLVNAGYGHNHCYRENFDFSL